jgi:phage-related minor tail protein
MLWESELTFDGILESFGRMLTQMVIQQQMTKLMGGAFDFFGAANASGGVYSGKGISAYSGQVVDRPTIFPFARGIGLMGEAGAEAILPLTRVGSELGVKAQSAPINFTLNIEDKSGSVMLEKDVKIIRPNPETIIANAVLSRKMTSRSWRQGMGVK